MNHRCRWWSLRSHQSVRNLELAARLKEFQKQEKRQEEVRARAADPQTTLRRVTAAATARTKLPSLKGARRLHLRERTGWMMATTIDQLTRNAIEMFAAGANRCCLDGGSDITRLETVCALKKRLIHPCIAPANHMWIPARGQPHETETTNQDYNHMMMNECLACCSSMRADAYATLAEITS